MKNSGEVVNLRFGLIVKVILFLVLMPNSLLACFGGGGGGGGGGGDEEEPREDLNATGTDNPLDEPLVTNLTGVKGPLDRNLKTALNGWTPSEEIEKEWREWYEKFKKDQEAIENATLAPGVLEKERGPGSGWPNLPGWAGLNEGNPGVPIPPWAYVPKNIGKPSICYLPPVRGRCKNTDAPLIRFGFNPYTDQCEEYEWSGCGGTRNRFTEKEKCEEFCGRKPPPSCTADSGIPNPHKDLFEALNL